MFKWQRKLVRQSGWIILCILFIAPANAAKLTKITFTEIDDGTRLVVNMDQPTPAHVFRVPNPERLVFDFTNAQLNTSLARVKITNPNIKTIRSGWPSPTILRLVLDLSSRVHYKIISNNSDENLVAELQFQKKITPPKVASIIKISPPTNTIPTQHKIIVVVIDPGHGGKDPGTIGEAGTKEKDVVLAIAKHLAELINHQPDMRAVLTRKDDYFVSLRNRLKLARKGRADLFIAIHADSYLRDNSSGASIYALSQRGATSEAARWLAKRDNYSELGHVDLGGLDDQSFLLRSVLIDLAQTATIRVSLNLGTAMLGSLDKVTRLHYPLVEQAPFVVLKSPDIPSVLVETGFLSNPNDEKQLSDPDYQTKLAVAMYDGIRIYLKKYS